MPEGTHLSLRLGRWDSSPSGRTRVHASAPPSPAPTDLHCPPPPQRRRCPTWRRRRQPGRRGAPSPSRPVLSARTATPSSGPTCHVAPARLLAARPGRPVGAPHPQPALSRPATAFSENRMLRTHPFLSLSSPSPSSKPGRHPHPDRPHRLPQVLPSGLGGGGEGTTRGLCLSPPWGFLAPLGLGTASGVRGRGGRRGPAPSARAPPLLPLQLRALPGAGLWAGGREGSEQESKGEV